MSAFWDEHDFTEFPEHYRELTEPVEVDIRHVDHYVKLEPKTLQRARRVARQRGLSTEKLINQWVREAVSRA